MNKKIIFYFLTALVVLTLKIDSSYSVPTVHKHDENYWTLEKMRNAKPLTTKHIGFRTRSGVETIKNTTDSSKDAKSAQPFGRKYDENGVDITSEGGGLDKVKAIAVGRLFMTKNKEHFDCTGSVINLGNGNIGVTAAHCLYDRDSQSYYDDVVFSPGYNNGVPGPLGEIFVDKMVVPQEYLAHFDDEFDWGVMLFRFRSHTNLPLKYFTGALGYQPQAGDNVQTTLIGYPDSVSKLPNCPNNALNLCTWQGVTKLGEDLYTAQGLNLGDGASGSPFITEFDPVSQLGLLYSNYVIFDDGSGRANGPVYDQTEFQKLIDGLSTP